MILTMCKASFSNQQISGKIVCKHSINAVSPLYSPTHVRILGTRIRVGDLRTTGIHPVAIPLLSAQVDLAGQNFLFSIHCFSIT